MLKIMNKTFKCSYKLMAATLTVIFALLFVFGANTNASEIKGSVSITLKTVDGNVMEGAEIRLYKVGEPDEERYKYVSDFSGCGANLLELSDKAVATEIYAYAISNAVEFESDVSTNEGKVSFKDLDLGVYLVAQGNNVIGFDSIAPFLVTVPNEVDGVFVYDVDASPKTVVTENVNVTVKKIWNDDGEKSRPASIKVVLKKGEKVLDTVTLSKENGWKYQWSNLVYSDKYSVEEIEIPKNYVATYKQNGLDFTIENTPKLVQTGQLQWPIPVMLTAGAFLIVLGICVGMKKDEKKSDNI